MRVSGHGGTGAQYFIRGQASDGGMSDPRNQALVAFRQSIIDFITVYEKGSPQINQWPLNIET